MVRSHLNGFVRAVNNLRDFPGRFMRTDRFVPIRALILLLSIWRCLNIATKETQINEEIRDKEVRVIRTELSSALCRLQRLCVSQMKRTQTL